MILGGRNKRITNNEYIIDVTIYNKVVKTVIMFVDNRSIYSTGTAILNDDNSNIYIIERHLKSFCSDEEVNSIIDFILKK